MKIDMLSDKTASRKARPSGPSPHERQCARQVRPAHFPAEAHAIIAKSGRSVVTSGKASSESWKLRFERRSAPYIEPLMGWTADDDTLSQLELSFPSADAAIAYAERQGLTYTVVGWCPNPCAKEATAAINPGENGTRDPRPIERIEPRFAAGVSRSKDAAAGPPLLIEPAANVIASVRAASEQPAEELYRWAYDAYVFQHRNFPTSEPSDAGQIANPLCRAEAADANLEDYRRAA